MKVELEVLASCNIKRKKPWPGLAFLGEVSVCHFKICMPASVYQFKIPIILKLCIVHCLLTLKKNGNGDVDETLHYSAYLVKCVIVISI